MKGKRDRNMNKNKKIAIGIFIIVLMIMSGIVVAYKFIENRVTNREDLKFHVENMHSTPVDTANSEKIIEWNEITEDGINEQLLFENVDTASLEKIAALLQSLSAEIAQKEQEDINFYLSAGWYQYALDSQQFNEVIQMGNDAIKPLYFILYKSPNQGSYEYICAMALSQLVAFDDETDSWSTSKEFLEKFNQKVLRDRHG